MSWLRAVWQWLTHLFSKEPYVAITCTAALTATSDLAALKLGDVLTYKVTIVGDTQTGSIAPGQVKLTSGQSVTPTGGPWTFTVKSTEDIGAPVVTGITLTKPFAQTTDPLVWTATV